VSWQNGSGAVHNVTFDNPAAAGAVAGGASGNVPEHNSGTNSRAFTAVGTHNFQCTLHFGMTGAVIVQ
ncbi:MAG TPA: plastocyanin/azurin family copper-binding protein, partial [Gemmatimonadaceae bacterium]|nr:plastocyanin/azurin family copper-binding protein [Gemmatimonadaceae bacterium]